MLCANNIFAYVFPNLLKTRNKEAIPLVPELFFQNYSKLFFICAFNETTLNIQ